MKCTSPANANVNSPVGRAGADGAGRVVDGTETETEAETETDRDGESDD
jgi:hypothetical protein